MYSKINLLFLVVLFFVFTSCTKTKTTIACFTFSKEKVKINDTLYLLNCSENYQKNIWLYPDLSIDSISRHSRIVAPSTPGTYDVSLYVGNYDMYSNGISVAKFVKKSFIVE